MNCLFVYQLKGVNVFDNGLKDVAVTELEKTIELLNSLVDSYKLEMALLNRQHTDVMRSVHTAMQYIEDGQPAAAHDTLERLIEPRIPKPDPVTAEIERVT